jgi:exodeoxyribonuclease VII small subunit
METEMGFEEALHELEGAVAALEGGDLGLDDALARYEQGIRLLGHCRALLAGAERRVALLTGVDADGQPETASFDASAVEKDPHARASNDGRPPARSGRRRPPTVEDDPPF